jgi:hypothetical protein
VNTLLLDIDYDITLTLTLSQGVYVYAGEDDDITLDLFPSSLSDSVIPMVRTVFPVSVSSSTPVYRVLASTAAGVVIANPTVQEHYDQVIGLSVSAGDQITPPMVCQVGLVEDLTFSFTTGPVYVSLSGALTNIAPTAAVWSQQVGVAISATKVVIGLLPANILSLSQLPLSSGNAFTVVAASTIGIHRVLVATPSGLAIADPTDTTNIDVVGLSISSATTGQVLNVLSSGIVSDVSFTFPAGSELFISSSGTLTTVAPTSGWFCQVGSAIEVGKINFDSEFSIVL